MNVEIRQDCVVLDGYVNVVDRASRVLRNEQGPYVERVKPGAFQKALSSGNAVELRFNHQRILGSTQDGTLELREDCIGLRGRAVITDPEIRKKAEAKELRGWSFGFVKRKDEWITVPDAPRQRTLEEMELREVSILDTTPAYVATSIELRGEEELLIEFRAQDGDAPDYTRIEETDVHTRVGTMTPEEETLMFRVQKSLEVYKLKRRNEHA